MSKEEDLVQAHPEGEGEIAGDQPGETVTGHMSFVLGNIPTQNNGIRSHEPVDGLAVTGHALSPRDSHIISWRVSQFGYGLRRYPAGTKQPENLERPSGGLRV